MLLSPWLWALVLLLTVSSLAFSFVKYEVGKEGWDAIIEKHPDLDRERFDRVTDLFDRHGSVVLLGSAIPGLDTVVTLTAGAVGVKKGTFIFWVFVAKFARFTLLAFLLAWTIGLVR